MKQKFVVTKYVFFITCLLAFNVCMTHSAYSQEDSDVIAEPYLYEGDMNMFDGRLKEAQDIYEVVLKDDPHNFEALWRLSRLYVTRGMTEKKKSDKKKEWKKAVDYGRRAVAAKGDEAEGHLYLAISMGKIALYSSSGEKVKFAWEIKEEAEKAIELDPSEQKAYLTLGAWHRNVAEASSIERQLAKMFFGELPEGSLEESLEFLLKSVSLGGTNTRNYYELALTHEAMGNYAAAKKEFENGLAAPPFYPEDNDVKERIKKRLCKSRYN